MDDGMTGEDLFDERRAGSWHAENENRNRRWIATAGFFLDQIACECLFDPIEQIERGILVVSNCRALGCVAGDKVLERSGKIFQIRISLAEGKIELHAVALRHLVRLRRERFHGREMRIAGCKGDTVDEINIGSGRRGIEPDRLQISLLCIVQPAEILERIPYMV